jgi:hypothetical protein
MIEYRTALLEDAAIVSERLRDADRREVRASGGDPLLSLQAGVSQSRPAITCLVDGTPEVIFGVVPGGPSTGYVWLLGSDAIVRHRTHFLRLSGTWVSIFHERYPVLTNVVDERNTVHLRWLRWLGFEFIRRHPDWGPERRPFIEFKREVRHV